MDALGQHPEVHLRGYDSARQAAKHAHVCWTRGDWTPARGWVRRAVECLPVGTEVRRRVAETYRVAQHAEREHLEQGPVVEARLLSVLRTIENAYWQLYLAQPAPESWMAL